MDNSRSEKEMSINIALDSATNIPPNNKNEFLNDVIKVEKSAWPPELQASREKLESRMAIFPQGFIVAKIDNKIKGVTTSQITNYDLSTDKTWNEITDNGTINKTHNPNADSLYVVSVGVSSDSQGKGIGGKLVAAQIELAKKLNLKRVLLGARVPGYNQYCADNKEVSVEDYLKLKDEKGEAVDSEIRFYERQGFTPVKVISNFESDVASGDYGVVMVWENK